MCKLTRKKTVQQIRDAITFFLTAKVASISQSGSLSLFSSKDLELEQRALLLKRLAFVIFCSDMDQYQKQMPEIQGKTLIFICFHSKLMKNFFFPQND